MFSKACLKYLGGIRTPHDELRDVTPLPTAYPVWGATNDAMGFGGRPFAIDFMRREFVLGTRYGRIARLRMVEPRRHDGDDVNTFPVADYVMPTMVELSGPSAEPDPPMPDRSWFEIADPWDTANPGFGGVLPLDDQVLIAGQMYYDANGTQRRSVALSDWPFATPATSYKPNRSAFVAVGEPTQQGIFAGYLCPVPEELQDKLKGNVLMGQGGLPIITRGSAGPSAVAFYVEDVLTHGEVPGTMLVCYPSGHWMPGHPWDNPNADEIYNQATQVEGMAIVGDQLVFVGSHGYGPPCYGDGTGIQPPPPGMCYDPSASAKGNHAYPYRAQIWHYPIADLIEVVEGRKEPWDLVPGWFDLDLPFVQPSMRLNGCAYDPATKRFYVSAFAADGYGYEPGPVIYAYAFVDDDGEPVPDVLRVSIGTTGPVTQLHGPTVATPPVVPPVVPPEDPCADLRQQVLALTVALDAETERHNATKADLGAAETSLTTINNEAETILRRNAGLKPKDKLPGWCTDAVKRIETLSAD